MGPNIEGRAAYESVRRVAFHAFTRYDDGATALLPSDTTRDGSDDA